MRLLLLVMSFFCLSELTFGQTIHAKSLKPDSTNFENIYVQKIHSDTLSSAFAIWVKEEVKPHKHEHHSEVVTVISGKGTMTVNGITKSIRKGDVIIIPKGTVHSVVTTSRKPLLVISVQSPKFVGKDRIWVID